MSFPTPSRPTITWSPSPPTLNTIFGWRASDDKTIYSFVEKTENEKTAIDTLHNFFFSVVKQQLQKATSHPLSDWSTNDKMYFNQNIIVINNRRALRRWKCFLSKKRTTTASVYFSRGRFCYCCFSAGTRLPLEWEMNSECVNWLGFWASCGSPNFRK